MYTRPYFLHNELWFCQAVGFYGPDLWSTEVKNCCPTGRQMCLECCCFHTNLWLLSSVRIQDVNEHLSFPDGVVKNKNSWNVFFQLGKKVPEKMMGLLRTQPELKVYRTDFHWVILIGILENSWNPCFGPLWRGTQRTYQMTVICSLVGSELSISTIFNMTLDCFVVSISSCQFGGWSENRRINFANLNCLFEPSGSLGITFWAWSPDLETRPDTAKRAEQTWDANGPAGWQNVWWI